MSVSAAETVCWIFKVLTSSAVLLMLCVVHRVLSSFALLWDNVCVGTAIR